MYFNLHAHMLKSINFLKYVNKYADKVYLEPQVL